MTGNFSKILTKLPVLMGMKRNMGEKFQTCKPGGGGCGFYINKKNKHKKSTQSDLLNYENIVN